MKLSRSLGLVFFVLNFSSQALAAKVSAYDANTETFKLLISKQYDQMQSQFNSVVEEYNKMAAHPDKLGSNIKDAKNKKYYEQYLSKHSITKLPELKVNGGQAYTYVNDQKISFDAVTLRDQAITVNKKEISFKGITNYQDRVQKIHETLGLKTTKMDQLVHAVFNEAIAANNESYVIGSLILMLGLNDKTVNKYQAVNNLISLLDAAKEMALACDNAIKNKKTSPNLSTVVDYIDTKSDVTQKENAVYERVWRSYTNAGTLGSWGRAPIRGFNDLTCTSLVNYTLDDSGVTIQSINGINGMVNNGQEATLHDGSGQCDGFDACKKLKEYFGVKGNLTESTICAPIKALTACIAQAETIPELQDGQSTGGNTKIK